MLNELGHDLFEEVCPGEPSPPPEEPGDSGRSPAGAAPLAPADTPVGDVLLAFLLSGATRRTSFCRHSCERLASDCTASRNSSGTPGPATLELLERRARSALLPLPLASGLPPLSGRMGERIGDESREAFCEDAGDVLSELEVEPERDVLRPEGSE